MPSAGPSVRSLSHCPISTATSHILEVYIVSRFCSIAAKVVLSRFSKMASLD